MYPPDGLLTFQENRHDYIDVNPHIIAPDPSESGGCLDEFPPADPFLLTSTEEPNMGEDEPSGFNVRLRPRKSSSFSPQNKTKTTPDSKSDADTKKSTPSKASPNNHDDLVEKSDFTHPSYFICPYCDKKFASKQAVTKHSRRMHFSSSKQEARLNCLFCNHADSDCNIIRHMVDSHPNQYFACLDCHTRFCSTSELAEHKLNVCDKLKIPYRTKLRQKSLVPNKKNKKTAKVGKDELHKDIKGLDTNHGFNGIVISCELKPAQIRNEEDIEDNITTNLILPPSKSLGSSSTLEKNAVIVLDDIQQWNKRIPSNFSFHNTDADQILSRLGVVQRTTKTGESTRKDWMKAIEESTQKFEKCFDTKFYSKVASNVQENLSKFLDGSFNFNPDPDSTIKTRKSKNSVIINTAEGFPILLASEQYSRSVFDSYLPRAIAPKHKWKWDSLENDKSPDQIKRDTHANNCIITLVSSLDIWTQLCMRQKFEAKFSNQPLEKKTEKQNLLSKELKEILESREIPATRDVMKYSNKPMPTSAAPDFPASLGLTRTIPTCDVQPAILSGEWVRPRCYVCCACGEHTTDSKGLSSHILIQHPNAQVQYYEIVGEPLLNADILKHLYVPPSQVSNRTRPPRGFRECTKCRKSVTFEDLHQHMLDCAGDTPTVRRRQCRHRPFGVRRRRPRIPDNTIRKKMRKDAIRSQQRRQKTLIRPRPRIRTEVGDAETIRKMLADLPAKRHRVLVNPMNLMQRPRKQLERQRNKLIMRKSSSEDDNFRKRRMNRREGKDSTQNEGGRDDEDDNKPLKPKLKSMIGRMTRQREAMKRQVLANRAKRKSVRVEQRKNESKLNKELVALSTSSTSTQGTSLDGSSDKVDLKKGECNSREHGNSGTSGNHDNQRPSCSGTNSSASNTTAPTHHVPLKHSIARLTADSERHDKSVQFHSLFLVQQECNNTNQHVPTGQKTLFENEAAITRLDKPPLGYCAKGVMDLNALQRSKLNKPRKGLNACIAMLKNKLVDPGPHDMPSHVSVQCGTDEPIDLNFQPIIQGIASKLEDTSNLARENADAHKVPEKNLQEDTLLVNNVPDQDEANVLFTQKENFHNETVTISAGGMENKVTASGAIINVLNHQSASVNNTCNDLQNKLPFCTEPAQYTNELRTESNMVTPVNEVKRDEVIKKLDKNLEEWNICAQTVTKPTNIRLDSVGEKQYDVLPLNNISTKDSSEKFTEKDSFNIPSDIPPAHASTNIESIISTPLDLSSKIADIKKAKLYQGSVCSFQTDYETLDLSQRSRKLPESGSVEDVIVDLSIKPTQIRYSSPSKTLDLCVKSTTKKISGITDIIANTRADEQFPTDLSVKRKTKTSDIRCEKPFVQDLSTSKYVYKDSKDTDSIRSGTVYLEAVSQSNTVLSTESNLHMLENRNEKIVTYDKGFEKERIKIQDFQDKIISDGNLGSKNYSDSLKGADMPIVKTSISLVHDRSSYMSKPVYDPTLKIPQYKIRANTVSTDMMSSKFPNETDEDAEVDLIYQKSALHQNVDKGKICCARTDQEISSFSFSTTSNSAAGKSPRSRVPRVFREHATTTCVNRIESTTPVYTLANACITVTKIESSSSTTLTNSLLSIPSSTIASTAPVYTLTGTTIAKPTKYLSIHGSDFHDAGDKVSKINLLPMQERNLKSVHETYAPKINRQDPSENSNDSCLVIEQDPETARKIAMLPKELVEILGTMPVDHRNQLLNVLPQYVSANVVPSQSSINKESENFTSHISSATSVSDIIKTCSTQAITACFPNSVNGKSVSQSTTPSEIDIHHQPIACTQNKDIIDESDHSATTKSLDCAVKSIKGTATDHTFVETLPSNAQLKSCKDIEKIIDLTKDESISSEVANIEVPTTEAIVPQEVGILNSAIKQKSNNDKTASLRAVRIKAPSERQKDNKIFKKHVSVDQIIPQHVTEPEENEVNKNKFPESNKSLAIQQAEISSTQQTNKTAIPDIKYSVDAISIDTESSIVRRVSNDNNIEKDNIIEVAVECPTTKSSLVTSSVPLKTLKGIISDVGPFIGEMMEDSSKECEQSVMPTIANTEFDKVENEIKNSDHSVTIGCNDSKGTSDNKLVSKPEDEDSEDDMILATIVKQKNHNMDQQLKSINKKPLSIKITNKKKKRTKKKLRNSRNKENPQMELHTDADKSIDISKIQLKSKIVEKKNISHMCPLNTEKELKSFEKRDFHPINHKDSCLSENDKINTKEIDISKFDKKDGDSQYKLQEDSNRKSIELDEICTANIPEVPAKLREDKEYGKKKRKQTEDHECKTAIQSGYVNRDIDTDCQLHSYKKPDVGKHGLLHDMKLEPVVKRPKKIESIDMLREENTAESILNDVNTLEKSNHSTPLRRSKRGKSLSTEIDMSDQEIANTDVIIDSKMPIPKKQLIFSKLLLDEENLSKNSSPEKEILTQSVASNEIDNLNVTNHLEIDEKIHNKNLKRYSIDAKNKIAKSKKLQPKKKYKKQKYKTNTCEDSNSKPHSQDDNTVVVDPQSNQQIDDLEQRQISEVESVSQENVNLESFEETENSLHSITSKTNVLKSKAITKNVDVAIEGRCDYDNANKKPAFVEKRKITAAPFGKEYKSSKPKKIKFDSEKDIPTRENSKPTNSDVRLACYNLPPAPRKTRSKSVVVGSSTDLYDPYDIDLEDMLDTNETPQRPTNKGRDTKLKSKSYKSSKRYKRVDYLDVENRKKKVDIKSSQSNFDQIQYVAQCNQLENEQNVNVRKFNDSTNKNLNSSKIPTNKTDDLLPGSLSDSDESSKSDVPLKKYIDEKLKASEVDKEFVTSVDIEADSNQNVSTSKKRNNNKYDKQFRICEQEVNNEDDLNVTDEQLRSEQFMESFGFFSERKPRKSNLLATKKISETFHIIANENDDAIIRNSKDRSIKKSNQSEKSIDNDNPHTSKNKLKRGRKKKEPMPELPENTTCYCELCKKEFRRHDNYVRHQLSLSHVAKLAEIELKFKTEPLVEEPNYLIVYKQNLDRLKQQNIGKKNSKCKIILPSFEDILAEVSNAEEERARQGLSRDEALFLDCCELLKESHKNDLLNTNAPVAGANVNAAGNLNKADDCLKNLDYKDEKCDSRSDGDVDSITAQNILDSEEVRNLENDLISGLKEAANAAAAAAAANATATSIANSNTNGFTPTCSIDMHTREASSQTFSDLDFTEKPHSSHFNDMNFIVPTESDANKNRRNPEFKEKMYPDVEEFDMFEDKFDKIKRKCRSQAAAAKQAQAVTKPEMGHKERKKSDKKKGKKSSKKNYQNTILTKGALKGFDGIKVSIPTSDIDVTGIITSHEASSKKKRKTAAYRKKKEKKDSETSKHDSENRLRELNSSKKVDVYEFMDNEDAELFEFRPSTLMERFKSITNNETLNTSKNEVTGEDFDNSSESASDGDDFVYMSDDYVCSDDETQSSLVSCEIGNVKSDAKKASLLKRKDVIEKNAVMGKIFKNNAVRTEKKVKSKETSKPKANLDQLFDSLLEEESKPSTINNNSNSPVSYAVNSSIDQNSFPNNQVVPETQKTSIIGPGNNEARLNAPKTAQLLKKNKLNLQNKVTSEEDASSYDYYGPSTSKRFENFINKDYKSTSPVMHVNLYEKYDNLPGKCKTSPINDSDLEENNIKDKATSKKSNFLSSNYTEYNEDTGVARQRARRKCTVGKQNVLAESWSSESEPDGLPRSNSTESVVAASGRKKKGRKKESCHNSSRRKKQDSESKAGNCTRNTSNNDVNEPCVSLITSAVTEKNDSIETAVSLGASATAEVGPMTDLPSTSSSSASHTSKVRPRPAAYYWSSEGDDEQEHLQQHGWIVGDSHKKLVTMLAHAKGRKRSNDDKRHCVE